MTSPSAGARTKVFISYVRENRSTVEKLAGDLQNYSLDIRTDFSVPVGTRWRSYLRNEISTGDYFVACFSDEYNKKHKSYMNEELTIAIEQLRLRSPDTVWFIPVKLNPCTIPDREIGAGEALTSLQWVDLFDDWRRGIEQIATAVGGKRCVLERESYPLDFGEYPIKLSPYAERLRALGLTPSKIGQCIDLSKHRDRNSTRFDVADIDEILFRRSSPAQLTMTPSDESYEEWSYEVHLVETVSFVNRGGMLLVDVVPQNIRDHPYDACLSIVKRDEGKQIGNMVRTLGQVTVDGTLPTVRTELERFVEVVAVVVFRWHFDGSKESEKLTLEIIELDK